MQGARRAVQVIMTLLANGWWAFPWTRNLYQGPLKVICSPGLNCYSCPASTTYCPVGALQQLLLALRFNWEMGQYYLGLFVVGTCGLLGTALGRFICGWACPFGLAQELLHRLPGRKFGIAKKLRLVKYAILLLMVLALPLLVVDDMGMGKPWFCKYLCPAGTLEAGLTMPLLRPELRASLGWLFVGKLGLLLLFLGWSVVAARPFCRVACPLGAFYGLFNRLSALRLRLDSAACNGCGACGRVCPVEIDFNETPGSAECVLCLRCMTGCPRRAIGLDFLGLELGRISAPVLEARNQENTT